MWRVVSDLGFDGGAVLEPGCGSGNFIGFAPADCDITGVEADAATADIARLLYGERATIHHQRFETFTVEDGHFDLAIGNVPFADITPHDPRHNRARHSLHNYFIVKSLHLTRPGGLAVLLTSRWTLDARNPKARREIAGLGHLLGAVRLPARAFLDSSGTEVVTDLLVLRRKEGDEPTEAEQWLTTSPAPLDDGEPIFVNDYFLAHPEHLLGTLAAHRGMYRERELTVHPSGRLEDMLATALGAISERARSHGLTYKRAEARPAATSVNAAVASDSLLYTQEGSLVVTNRGFGRIHNGSAVPFEPRYRADSNELRRLVRLRDAARAVLAAQVDGADDATLRQRQQDLSLRYDSYLRAHGPLNRFAEARSGRVDPETGEEIVRRIRPRMGGFRDDPDWPLVAALEVFDDSTQRAVPADIFTKRIISPPVERLGVDTPAEAIAVCLDETGTVTLERIADLLGIDKDTARAQIEGLAWEDPASGELEPTSRYLSGNIRRKLAVARAAAKEDERFAANVAALEVVLPRQLEPSEITAAPGAPWIPPSDIEAFCSEVLRAEVDVERVAELGRWTVRSRSWRGTVTLTSEWGTSRADGITLLDAALNQRLHTVYDTTDDNRRVRNDPETIAARDKQEALADRFAAWVWEDSARATRLAQTYNHLFCSVVVPAYDGSHLSLPGIAETFTPHQHQRNAVARILTDGRALLAHAVGAGKTATMAMAAMELRRLGLVSKPAVAVPNHMLEQFTREWLQLYPTARLLIADQDRLSKERRKEFVARCATGDWDAVVFSHSGFGRLPLGGDLLADYMGEELAECRAALEASTNGKGLSVKRLEKRIAQLEETYARLLAAETKDDGVRFEETGIDYLFVDEAHLFKNRRVNSSIDGMGTAGSQRAQDLDAKLWALRRARSQRVTTFATATDVSNSIAELWTMQTYLQPDVLEEVGLGPFDAWAATFGRTVSTLELSPDGSSYRMQTRFARFQNVPELLGLYRQVADVRTREDLNLPVPTLKGGGPETIVVPASDELLDYVGELAARAERVRSRAVEPHEDNMLKISGDGRRAALDMRLVGRLPERSGGKLATAADHIAAIHHATREHTYLDPTGAAHPRPGALQLVFCDVSTPASDGWNAYDELRRLLVARGVPADGVRFIHEAATDQAKANLFAACRDGRVSVLVGSTEKMGVGTNVQARAIALHHLDCPWRPADIEQREGRIIRQGNQNGEVRVLRYATEGSFDIYMWQTVERKATFINQVVTGRAVDREVEDIGDQALSFAEVKALATGDPLILEKAEVDTEVAKLGRLRRAHLDDQHRLRKALGDAERRARSAGQRIDRLEAAIAIRVDTRGDRFAMTIEDRTFRKRAEAADHLQRLLNAAAATVRPEDSPSSIHGTLAGLAVQASVDKQFGDVILTVPAARVDVICDRDEFLHADPTSQLQRLERKIQNLDLDLRDARSEHQAANSEVERASSRLGGTFEHEERLRLLQRRQHEINEQLLPPPESVDVEPSAAQRMARRLASPPPTPSTLRC